MGDKEAPAKNSDQICITMSRQELVDLIKLETGKATEGIKAEIYNDMQRGGRFAFTSGRTR